MIENDQTRKLSDQFLLTTLSKTIMRKNFKKIKPTTMFIIF